jgi:hypothetical protein
MCLRRLSFDRRSRMFRNLIRDENGVSLLVTAISLSVTLGFTALGVETSMWYTIIRHNQSAADMAALSGAMELASQQASSDVCAQAKAAAILNGFPASAVVCNVGLFTSASQSSCEPPPKGTLLQNQMCVNSPPVFGNYAGTSNYLEVVLGWQQTTWFTFIATGCNNPGNARACAQSPSTVQPVNNVPLYVRGVAKVTSPPGGAVACVLALTTSGTGISAQGGADVVMPNCGAVSDSLDPSSSYLFGGSSTTFDPSFYMTPGGVNISGGPTINGNRYYGSLTDPYSCNPPAFGCIAKITWPTVSGSEITSCSAGGTSASPVVLKPGLYSGPICATSGYYVFCPGVYVIDGADNTNPYGAFEVSGTSTVVQMGTAGKTYPNGVTCPTGTMLNGQTINGVTFIATSKNGTKGGGFDIKQASITLSAPTSSPQSGIPSGILFAQDPSHANTQNAGNGFRADSSIQTPTNAAFTGSMYTPATNLTLQAQVNSTCFIVLALTVGFQGGASLAADQNDCQAAGVQPPPEVLTAGFAE